MLRSTSALERHNEAFFRGYTSLLRSWHRYTTLLEERGIELVEQRASDIGDFSSMIPAEVASEERTAVAYFKVLF